MGIEGVGFDGLEGVTPSFAEALYRRYRADPQSVEPDWQDYFEGAGDHGLRPELGAHQLAAERDRRADRRARPDADGGRVPSRQGREAGGERLPRNCPRRRNDRQCGTRFDPRMMLIRTYRVRGHLLADLDPLGLSRQEMPADLTPEYYGFTDADLDRPIFSAARWA
jgi:2-oxoglutarate dehydrogenase E1 component